MGHFLTMGVWDFLLILGGPAVELYPVPSVYFFSFQNSSADMISDDFLTSV